MSLINNNFGRYANGHPRVECHLWDPAGIDSVEWRDLTNEEIIVAVSHKVIVAVVLQDKTENTGLKHYEPAKIKQLFDLFHSINDESLGYKVFLCSTYIVYKGQLRVSNRAMRIEVELHKHMNASAYHHQTQELLPKTHERIVTAKSCGMTGDHPAVVGGYVHLPSGLKDESLGFSGPSFKE